MMKVRPLKKNLCDFPTINKYRDYNRGKKMNTIRRKYVGPLRLQRVIFPICYMIYIIYDMIYFIIEVY